MIRKCPNDHQNTVILNSHCYWLLQYNKINIYTWHIHTGLDGRRRSICTYKASAIHGVFSTQISDIQRQFHILKLCWFRLECDDYNPSRFGRWGTILPDCKFYYRPNVKVIKRKPRIFYIVLLYVMRLFGQRIFILYSIIQ